MDALAIFKRREPQQQPGSSVITEQLLDSLRRTAER